MKSVVLNRYGRLCICGTLLVVISLIAIPLLRCMTNADSKQESYRELPIEFDQPRGTVAVLTRPDHPVGDNVAINNCTRLTICDRRHNELIRCVVTSRSTNLVAWMLKRSKESRQKIECAASTVSVGEPAVFTGTNHVRTWIWFTLPDGRLVELSTTKSKSSAWKMALQTLKLKESLSEE